jgi:hypothetical protein
VSQSLTANTVYIAKKEKETDKQMGSIPVKEKLLTDVLRVRQEFCGYLWRKGMGEVL